MLYIKSYEVVNNEWVIVTDNDVTIHPSVAREVGMAIEIMFNAAKPASIQCVATTLNASTEMRECAEYMTELANSGMDVDGDYIPTLTSMYL